jgi:quinol monooxygenase YgiN
MSRPVPENPGEPDLTVVTLVLDAADARSVASLVSRYVVTTRAVPGCLNVDLCASMGVPDRFVVIEKWATPGHQARHGASPVFEEFARSCQGLLAGPPQVDLLSGISAHDLA